jgi:predicted dehydrogenase
VMDKTGSRQIAMPDDLTNPPPTPFPVTELIQTEQDRWHTMGIDVAPYARLFTEMRQRIAGLEVNSREVAGSFVDAVQGQAVLDAARRSAAEGQWVDVA